MPNPYIEGITLKGTEIDFRDNSAVRSVNSNLPDEDGNVLLNRTPLADNLYSEDVRTSTSEFIIRASGGDVSVSDGEAWLTSVKGNLVRTGYVERLVQMTVTPYADPEREDVITATIDEDEYDSAVQTSGTQTFTYTTEWSDDPSSYGITVSGTPVDGDEISVFLRKEQRGTITTFSPSVFFSTGWNLFSNNLGYAHVVDYAQEGSDSGYIVGGAFNALNVEFSTTTGGERTSVNLVDIGDGMYYFVVNADGYVWLTNTDDSTTFVLMTKEDWQSGYEGEWEAYSESTIDVSTIVGTYFPTGMAKVGVVADEINLSIKMVYKRINRISYSQQHLEDVIALGTSYIYDENYIYYVMEIETQTSIESEIDGEYIVNGHGIEGYQNTTIAGGAVSLYGQNLKKKLTNDVVTISAMNLSTTQKASVRNNIGAVGLDEAVLLSAQTLTTTQKTTARNNIEAAQNSAVVHNTGDETITGTKWMDNDIFRVGNSSRNRYKYLSFMHSADSGNAYIRVDAGNKTNQTTNRMAFMEYSPNSTASATNTGKCEIYQLPAPTAGLSANATYNILTSKTVTADLTLLPTLFLRKSYSYSYTLSGGDGKAVSASNLGISSISGYTPIAVIGYETGSSSVVVYRTYSVWTISSSAQTIIRISNEASGSVSATLTVYILFGRSGFIGS